MANHPYQHPSAGPSYYPVYGNHSPGPHPNFYPYPPPHMVSHSLPQYQHPTPSRGSHRGGHVNGSYNNSRGSHQYHHHGYHAHLPPQSLHPPNLNTSVNPQNPYSTQPAAKYNSSYSQSYHYPSPNAPVFTPSWQTHTPISPLPKQLSMPPPPNGAYYDSSQDPVSQRSPIRQTPVIETSELLPTVTPPAISTPEPALSEVIPSAELEPKLPSDAPPVESSSPTYQSPDPQADAEEGTSIQHQSPLYSQTGTIHRYEVPGDAPALTEKLGAQWAIWSRRPQNPSHAPGVIISPKANPPPDVIQQALDLKTPPSSPTQVSLPLQPVIIPIDPVEDGVPRSSSDSQTNSTVPSSATTESEETPTAPGSPVSSHTSVSVTGTSAKDSTVHPKLTSMEVVPPSPTPQAIVPSTDDTIESTATSSSAETSSITSETGVPETQAVQSAPIAVIPDTLPTTVVPPPQPKKSWASLLQKPSVGNSLPTSSVVGFSIPAASQETSSVPVTVSRKSALLNILTSPATTVSTSMPIRSRGLINNGNMCFANSVLQVLVYCPPFQKLFLDLSRQLDTDGVNSKDNKTRNPLNNFALINATATFLQEFLDIGEKKSKTDSTSRTGSNNSGNTSFKGNEKGKGREFKDDKSVGDEWDEPFLPSYVYDVMKTKKRFDTMRGGHQEDAEEFFGFYLDTLEEELLALHAINSPRQKGESVTPSTEEKEVGSREDGWLEVGKRSKTLITRTIKSTDSPITKIFGGKFRTTLRALGQKDSVIVEDWRSLRLDIQREQIHTIQDALSYISHPQPVQVTLPAKPGTIVEAKQQVLIEALPPILVLHIKRFYYDTTVGGVVKICKHVQYGSILEIPSDIMAKRPAVRYKLFGVLYHHGQSASGGHYTLDVLHSSRFPKSSIPEKSKPKEFGPVRDDDVLRSLGAVKPGEGWVRIDDDLVSDVRSDDVFTTPELDDTRCAYLLFYRKM